MSTDSNAETQSEEAKKIAYVDQGQLIYWCEGCKHPHVIPFGTEHSYRWEFNGDLEHPTLSPSIRSQPPHCHHFLRDGKIEYLSDCAHSFANKTVPLTPFRRDWYNEK